MTNPESVVPLDVSYESVMDILDEDMRRELNQLYDKTGDVIDAAIEQRIECKIMMVVAEHFARLLADTEEPTQAAIDVCYRSIIFGLQTASKLSDNVGGIKLRDLMSAENESYRGYIDRLTTTADGYMSTRPVLRQFVKSYAVLVDETNEYRDFAEKMIGWILLLAERNDTIERRRAYVNGARYDQGDDSEFAARPYTVVDRRVVGMAVLTTVIKDGEWIVDGV
jgi:hypothetical protein